MAGFVRVRPWRPSRERAAPPVCAEHRRPRPDGGPGCFEPGRYASPCDGCGGIGAACLTCGGTGRVLHCPEHQFTALLRRQAANRARGLCPCGDLPDPGHANCRRCRTAEGARKRRKYARARELRKRIQALPSDLRLYGEAGLALHATETERRRRRAQSEAQRIEAHRERLRPVLPTLTAKQRAFVVAYVENGGNATRAALAAGYGAGSHAGGVEPQRCALANCAGIRGCRAPSSSIAPSTPRLRRNASASGSLRPWWQKRNAPARNRSPRGGCASCGARPSLAFRGTADAAPRPMMVMRPVHRAGRAIGEGCGA